MAEFGTPSEIAREVLRRLATQRKPPTPDNYRELYQQISGTNIDEVFPERQFKMVAAALPRSTPEQLKATRRFESAIAERSWQPFKTQLIALLTEKAPESPGWGALVRDLVTQYERPTAGMSSQAKLEALTHVLDASSTSEASVLFGRLQGMVRGWSQGDTAEKSGIEVKSTDLPLATEQSGTQAAASAATPAAATPSISTQTAIAPRGSLADAPEAWRVLVGQTLENAIGILLIDTPELVQQATILSKALRNPETLDITQFEAQLQEFSYKVQWVVQDQSYIRQALMNLLQLIIENISELAIDDKWMQGQMSMVLDLFSRPLDKKVLDELRERLRDVIFKQGTLKRSLSDAHDKLRDMLAHFIDRLSELAESTGTYHSKIEVFAARVGSASSLSELSGLVDEVLNETRMIESRTRRSQDELSSLRSTVDQAYKEIARLEDELQQASELVRHDPLTGTLNRKGLEEILGREMARQQRRNSRLCIALLDVDNFKSLNDTYGHATGDDALRHLAQVIRETLRPQDSCGRYGGEEFLILLPDTTVEESVVALTRLQRELTKRFFLHENKKLLITFSAGVTELVKGEDPDVATDRADKAMYRAKRAGKNRVESS
ncbi:GGDEF domain-containing protein [Uliginosibacterium sp. H3]|uniref:diguanylate cyclase n=1 Tax=Uliginosibacterium silvisoli TaxID=3114758 RepID=A0ABU6K245_9RHOO|nr:GGDEF domain-containing protein [Uliginosibacterium sp. H3]